jgi:pimeloyl-ACP methyl ester carboxylesterase
MVKSLQAAFATAMVLLLMASPAPQRKTRTITIEGMSFGYVDLGSGPPVILIHGSMSDYREWSSQMEALAKHYHVIAYSRRYHWPNTPPGKDADATVPRQTEDLAAIIKSLGLAPASVVAHSYGGTVALSLALQHPELVRTLVLLDPGVPGVLVNTPESEGVVKERQAFREEMSKAFDSGDAERIVRTALANFAPGEFDNAPREIRDMYLANVPAFRLDLTAPRPTLTCEDIRRIAAPALVLTGGRSPMQQTATGAAHCLKSGSLLKLPQATHHMQLDHPQEVNDAVLAFLAKH